MPLEIAVFSVEDAIIASTVADRVELCSNYELGGTTLPLDDLRLVRRHWIQYGIDVPMMAIIRPVGGSFCYEEEVFKEMYVPTEIG